MATDRFVLQVYVGAFSHLYEALSIEASKQTSAEEIVECISEKLDLLDAKGYELAEVIGNGGGQDCKERRLSPTECPVALQLLWPKYPPASNLGQSFQAPEYRFCLRRRLNEGVHRYLSFSDGIDSQLIRDYFLRFLYQPKDKEYPDLCQLPDLTERTLLDNLKARFEKGHIYTYVGSILIAVNPFKYYPIYNPKYVKLYQNRRLGELPPHIFAIADAAYQSMLRDRTNQCVVISGESGSGKTESTNLLLHHLTALSQKGSHGSGVEQTILGAGPVLEAFGNAKTKHNNNSSRFGKFIQVNYKENGMVHGAVVQKYLLEKSRIVSQARNERNYHVFYYLLAGVSNAEKESLHLGKPQDYHYLNQSNCYTLDGVDEVHEFSRLRQSMEMVGFSSEKQRRLLAVLSAVLHLGNVEFIKKSTYHNDEAVGIKNPEVISIISSLLMVKEETLTSALTCKRAKAREEILVINYKMPEALATRDAMAKCLYGALFDWIVMQLNHALLTKKDAREHKGNFIGVLDIFGFEDFGDHNSYEQFCINFANEHLQCYFNQHVFKYEQEEYKREGIRWKNIDFMDNSGCLNLTEGRPHGLLCLLDDQCSFPGASNETLLQKFENHHKDSGFFEVPPRKENCFLIKHYAGKVKYQIKDFREKNLDLMRPDVVSVLKSSSLAFVRELVGADPVAVFRWAILRAFFRSYFAFIKAGRRVNLSEGKQGRGLRKTQSGPSMRKCNLDENIPSPIRCHDGRSGGRRPLSLCNSNMEKLRAGQCYKDGLTRPDMAPCPLHGLQTILCASEAKVLERANQIMLRNKFSRPRNRNEKSLKNLQTVKCIVGKAHHLPQRNSRKQPPTVSAQFQASLNQLMEALNQADPFFVRCIKSNSEKVPNNFDEAIVLRQLRYTGMLETVRIRQSGYSVRLTFDEFIHHYRILLPKGLLSSQADIHTFLLRNDLNRKNYQMGKSKVFMRESEKMKLDENLHQAILYRIVLLQQWVRTWLARRHFLQLRKAIVIVQAHARRKLAQRKLAQMQQQRAAALLIQKTWRGYYIWRWYQKLRFGCLLFQSAARGFLVRQRFISLWKERQKELALMRQPTKQVPRSTSDQMIRKSLVSPRNDLSGVSQSTLSDEAFLSKGSSQEELEMEHTCDRQPSRDSEESSGIHEDSEAESLASEGGRGPSSPSLSPPKRDLYPNNKPQLSKPNHYLLDNSRRIEEMNNKQKDNATGFSGERVVRRRPIRKLSLRRLKSANKSVSKDGDSENFVASQESQNESYSQMVCPSSEKIGDTGGARESYNLGEFPDASGKGPLQKARRHLKTFIVGKEKKKDNLEESDDSGQDDIGCFATEDRGRRGNSGLSVESFELHELNPVIQSSVRNTHNLKHMSTFHKMDTCSVCEKGMSALFNHGFKCAACKLFFHPKCVQQASHMPCQNLASNRGPRNNRKQRKPSKAHELQQQLGTWNVTRTAEFRDPKDILITDVQELQTMGEFIFRKVCQMNNSDRGQKDSPVDEVFKRALREFKSNLVSTYSVAAQDGHLSLRYKDLIDHFEQVMHCVCQQENTSRAFPVIMGVNAFRGFMDEFRNLYRSEEKPKAKGRKRKRKKADQMMEHMGHKFMPVITNIPTACEVCSSFMWLMEKVYVCQGCKMTCHKKCHSKVPVLCRDMLIRQGHKLFGAPLERLVSEENRIPVVVERLITAIEMKGLYTEGIYRKSGIASHVRELKQLLEDAPESVDLDSFSVHVLTTVLKSFFREMPEPLMTYELYDDFLRATQIADPQERVQALYCHVYKLPRANYDLLERLIFHLARVAQQEEANRMSPNALAIVFAPCILRTNKRLQAQDSLKDISKQTMCVEGIISEQVHQVRSTLADIDTLDTAWHTASSRLSSLRSSKMFLAQEGAVQQQHSAVKQEEEEEALLSQHIENLQSEKVHLTTVLPTLRLLQAGSDEDLLSSTDIDSTAGSLDDINVYQQDDLNAAFDFPAVPPKDLKHLTKRRVSLPSRRMPSRFARMCASVTNFGEYDGDASTNSKRTDNSVVSLYQVLNNEEKKPIIV